MWITSGRRWAAMAGAIALGACAVGDAQEAEPADATATAAVTAARAPAALEGAGPWMAASTGGAHVTLSAARAPLVEGPQRLGIEVHAALDGVRPLSVDLTSPTMPMHGVIRVPVTETEEGWVADVHIPMGGLWAVYVNLDEGADAAEFLFEVLNADGSAGHEHHGMAPGAPAATNRGDGGPHEHGAHP